MIKVKKKQDWKLNKTLWTPGPGRKRVSSKEAPCLTRYLGLDRIDEETGKEIHKVEFRISGKRGKDGEVLESDRVEIVEFSPDDNLIGIAHVWAAGKSTKPAAKGAGRHMTVKDTYLRHVLPEMARERSNTGSNSTRSYHQLYGCYLAPAFGEELVAKLEHEAVKAHFKFLADPSRDAQKPHGRGNKGYSKSVLSDALVVLRKILTAAVENGYRETGPDICKDVYKVWKGGKKGAAAPTLDSAGTTKELSRIEYWDADQRAYFLANAPQSDEGEKEMRRFGLLSVAFAPRPGEMCAVMISDLKKDEETGGYHLQIVRAIEPVDEYDEAGNRTGKGWRLCYTKNGEEHQRFDLWLLPIWGPIIEEQIAYVKERQARGEFECNPDCARFLFPPHTPKLAANPFNTQQALRDRWSDYLKKIEGLDYIHPYGLRHTGATWLLEQGWTADDVAAHIGDTVTMVQNVYGHLVPKNAKHRYMAMLGRTGNTLGGFAGLADQTTKPGPALRAIEGGDAKAQVKATKKRKAG